MLDLPAAEAVYHQACSVNFRTGKNVPKAFETSEQCSSAKEMKSPGRPEATEQANAFKQNIETIETCEDATLTVNDLVLQMADVVGDQCYSKKHMKKKIIDYFGDYVIVSSIDGKHDIISLRQNTSSSVHEFYENSRGITDGEKKQQIIDMAAKLIKGDINSLYHNKDLYLAKQSKRIPSTHISKQQFC